MNKREKIISNWGNYPKIKAQVLEPKSLPELKNSLLENSSVITRGNGRCYGDAALSQNIISTLKLNKFLAFDQEKGILACQAGVLLSDILEVIIPKGYFLPVTPGTKFITVGGALAADVHGKNHHKEGCFSDHVISFELMNERGEIITCTRDQNADYFWNTIGGMGLTGIILSCKFWLKSIETAYIRHEAIKAKDLDEAMDLFENAHSWTYSMAWIDCLQKGKYLGRSIVMLGEHAHLHELSPVEQANPLFPKKKRKLNVPFSFPSLTLNTYSVKAFNFAYYNKQIQRHIKKIVDYDSFFYPLDSIHNWNRIYGKNGFTQYQFVLPKNVSHQGLKEILQTIAKSGQGSFLAVLKLFGKNNPLAFNSFPIEGYTLALDFKINKNLLQLIKHMDKIVKKYDGKVYLAKDAFSSKELSKVTPYPSEKFSSLQKQRILNNSKAVSL